MIPPDTLSPLHLRGFEAICRNSWFSPGGPRCSPVHLPPPPPPADDQLGVDAGAPRLVICGQGSDVGRVTRDDATPASTHRSTVRAADRQQTDLTATGNNTVIPDTGRREGAAPLQPAPLPSPYRVPIPAFTTRSSEYPPPGPPSLHGQCHGRI